MIYNVLYFIYLSTIPFYYLYNTIKLNNTYNIFSYIDIEYVMSKIISTWSSMEYLSIIMILINIIVILYNKKENIIIHIKYNTLIIIFANIYIATIINYSQIQAKNFFFNPLLNHTMGSIHPPLILITFFIVRYYIKENNYLKFIFFFISISIWTGSIWSSTLFGWNGLWMWDTIENISIYYWFLILIVLHIKNKNESINIYETIYIIDVYFFILFKINIINSIHSFQTNSIIYNKNDYLVIAFIFVLINIIYTYTKSISKYDKKIKNKNVTNYFYFLITNIIILFIIVHLNNSKTNKYIPFNSIYYYILYLFILFLFIIYIKEIKFFIFIIPIIFLNNTIYFLLIIFIIILLENKKNDLLKDHFFYFFVLYLFINYSQENQEIYSIYTNNTNISYIKDNIYIIKENINIYKAHLENKLVNNYNNIYIYNNEIINKKYNTFTQFYRKTKEFINDKNSNYFYISTTNNISYNTNLKEIKIIKSHYLAVIIYTIYIYLYKHIKKMHIFNVK